MVTRKSAKSKGYQFQRDIVKDIQDAFGLTDDDIRPVPNSQTGMDIQLLSNRSRELFPFSVECKRVEKLNIEEAFNQAVTNSVLTPLLIYKKNHKTTKVVLEWDTFLHLLVSTPSLHQYNNDIDLNELIEMRDNLDRIIGDLNGTRSNNRK